MYERTTNRRRGEKRNRGKIVKMVCVIVMCYGLLLTLSTFFVARLVEHLLDFKFYELAANVNSFIIILSTENKRKEPNDEKKNGTLNE